ncbi:unnamed protein product [Withania somnifera]
MAVKKIIAICQSGGKFVMNNEDGSLSYIGGNTYAVDIDENTNVHFNVDGMTIMYFLPGIKKTLITVSKDKDLQCMLNFFKEFEQLEVFVVAEGAVATDVSNMPASSLLNCSGPAGQLSETALSTATPVDLTNPDGQLMVDTPIDTTPLGILPGSNDDKHRREATQWENSINGVEQRFSSFNEFHIYIYIYIYIYKKNDIHRVMVKFKSEGCPWRIYASRLATTQLIRIKKMYKNHTCEGASMKEKLKFSPNYKPKDITTDIKPSYRFCERIMETNPGSLATFATKEDSSFDRLFVSFHASIYGFQQGCRPLLFLDSTVLYAKYQGTLLSAVGADVNDGVFPVAFAVFLSELKSVVSTARPITFVSAFQNGIKESLYDIFSKYCYHGYFLRYLWFSHEVRRLLIQDLYAAACAPILEDFELCVENIKATSPDAYSWVVQSEPDHWANAFFGGARYDHMTSNFGQLFRDWLSDMRKMMELNYTRRVHSSQWLTRLTPSVEEKLQNETSKAISLQVLHSHGSTCEVRGEAVDIVDIDNWDCSCKACQLNGFPCCHAIAILECLGRSPYDYCSRYFTTESYPEVDMEFMVSPPPIKHPPGRPKMKQQDSLDIIKQLQCSKKVNKIDGSDSLLLTGVVVAEEPEVAA